MTSKEKFERIKDLMEVEKEQLELALDVVNSLAEDNSSNYPDEIKSKISNASRLLEEVDQFYEEALEENYEDYEHLEEEGEE